MARKEELVVIVDRKRHQWDETVVFSAVTGENGQESRIGIKGRMSGDAPKEGETYRLYGRWTEYTNNRSGVTEKQFVFDSLVAIVPQTERGVVAYLKQLDGIGPIAAANIYREFGGNAVDVLRKDPYIVSATIQRLSTKVTVPASKILQEKHHIQEATIALYDLLNGRGFPGKVTDQAIDLWGNSAADVIRDDPYVLMKFRGVGFAKADSLYLELGGDPNALNRQALCAWYAISKVGDGSTWSHRGAVTQSLAKEIGAAEIREDDALALAVSDGLLVRERTATLDGGPYFDGRFEWLAESRDHNAEQQLAEHVIDALKDNSQRWPEVKPGSLKSHQLEMVSKITSNSGAVASLGGSPGTGKTYVAAQIISNYLSHFGADKVFVCAPTGKAAVRITEAMADHGIPLRGRTIHSTLKVLEANDGAWSFEFGKKNPLPARLIVVDEVSMCDTALLRSLMSARPRGCLVLLVGDIGQLPPVGRGAPLRDMLAAGIPHGELTEIHRNGAQIAEVCAAIKREEDFYVSLSQGNLRQIPRKDPKSQIDAVKELLDRQHMQGKSPVWDCQVIVTVNKKSEVSREAVNSELQTHLNDSPEVKNSPFKVGDKVICLKNSLYSLSDPDAKLDDEVQTNQQGKVYVANGEMGEAVMVEPKRMFVRLLTFDHVVVVPRGLPSDDDEKEDVASTGCDWALGYAITCHKSQGSGFPIVAVMLDASPGAMRLATREHIYTAISRAEKECYLIGDMSVVEQAIAKTAIDKRKTFLKERISNQGVIF